MTNYRGKKRMLVGLIMQALAISIFLVFALLVFENLGDIEAVIQGFFVLVPILWLAWSAFTFWAVAKQKLWSPTLALVRSISTIIALIWLGAVSPLLVVGIFVIPMVGLPLLLLFLVELAGEILFISGGIGAWRSRAALVEAQPTEELPA